MKIEKGKWYWISYGYRNLRAKCVEVFDNSAAMKFYWGDLFSRGTYNVENYRIHKETKRPLWRNG